MHAYCGTPLNMAPEIMNRRPYTYKADIWSVGVLIFLLLTGAYPFFARTKVQLQANIDRGLYSINRKLKITPACLDFINKCLQHDTRKRIDWPGIEAHPFYNHRLYYKTL